MLTQEVFAAVPKESNRIFLKEYRNIVSTFQKSNIPIVGLKGIFLTEQVYPDLGLRPMTDIDLLIHKKDLPRIEEALLSLGYVMHPNYRKALALADSPYINAVMCKKVTEPFNALHLHWHILNHSFLPALGYVYDFDMTCMWKEALSYESAGEKAFGLKPAHLLIHLAMHHLKHDFDKMILFSDIDAVIAKYGVDMNWKELKKEAEFCCV